MDALLEIIPTRLRPPWRRRVQFLSDLHLEVGQQYSSFTFPVTAPFLLLGGDIGRLIDYENFQRFLQAQVSRYEKVFLVLGNHEFYGLDYDSGLEEARRLSKEPSLVDTLVLLHRNRWDDPNSRLTILGCTLWSAIPESAYSVVESKINDFKKINGWTAQKHNKVHANDLTWLRDQAAKIAARGNSSRRVLIATHHAPCLEGTSRPGQSSNPWTPAFATDLVDKEGWDCVKIWAFGHTHYCTDMRRNGIRVVANQRGYILPGSPAHEAESTKTKGAHTFDPTKVLTL